ncbi:DnaJ domain-containing protein [Amorphus coralli]|uniref:DnaJ domain-containing protein n=1 Tax=Amorphus coralli TaxID=340680 RepID=UPI0003724F1D|nr:DnaJ domain-containing protein [Amorphus coralli]
MIWLLLGLLALAAIVIASRSFTNADPAALAHRLRVAGGVVLLLIAAGLGVRGLWPLAGPLGFFSLSLLGLGSMPGLGRGARGASRSAGQASEVTTDWLHLKLDHDSGAIAGEVRAGRLAGRSLDSLSEAELSELLNEVAADPDSVVLVEAYLDRRSPGWREDVHEDAGARQGGAAATGPLSEEEAYEVLGLQPGASEGEIRAAHRRLMKGLHPDRGGSTFLASKINEAKERLLRGHN